MRARIIMATAAALFATAAANAANAPGASAPGAKPATIIHLKWNPKNFPLKFRVWEAHPAASENLQINRNVRSLTNALPVQREIVDGNVTFLGEGSRLIALSVDNPTDKDFFFIAAPHAAVPPEAGLGVYFKCLCLGDVHRVKAHRTFFRVMELKVLPSNRYRDVTLTHDLMPLPPDRLKEYESEIYE